MGEWEPLNNDVKKSFYMPRKLLEANKNLHLLLMEVKAFGD